MAAQQCRSRNGDLQCQRGQGHEGPHRAEAGKPDEQVGVAIVGGSNAKGAPIAQVVSWT